MAKTKASPSVKHRPADFQAGDLVRVIEAYPLGHVRTPYYIRGKTGTVERLCGAFPNPEELAQMRDGLPAQPLYRVRFRQGDVWPDYEGSPNDVVEVEIYQHWLEKP
ncbi:MAG TPA: SH3-like domain-containing protein [Burkholderiales bacterium]